MKQIAPHRTFDLEELAFFWLPRAWPEIVARFGEGQSGSHADVRDAIICVDDDGGIGYLHWHAPKKAWALTDAGKKWVAKLLTPKKLEAARSWTPPEKDREAAAKQVEQNAIAEYE